MNAQTKSCIKCGVSHTKRKKADGRYYLTQYCPKCYYLAYNKGRKFNRVWFKQYREKQRTLALEHYGGIPPKCACCGETHREFLVIDHINGGGNSHRKAEHISGGGQIYDWLKRMQYPLGFRVLCDNCNMSYGRYGYCPHRRVEEQPSTKGAR